MEADLNLTKLLTLARIVEDPPRVIREIQLKLDKAVNRHKKELRASKKNKSRKTLNRRALLVRGLL